MKTNNLKSLIGAAALCATLAVPQLASAAVTPPVGYVKLTFNAESDTPFSLPMNRPMVYSGLASAISGNVISIANTDFTADEFVYDETNQNENYYVIFKTGALEGRKFDVTVNAAGSVTVNPDHTDDNSGDTVASLGAAASDTFEIRPHWTLNTLFPDGGVLPPSSNRFAANGRIFGYENTLDGINSSSSNSYIYVTGDTWYDTQNLGDTLIGDKVLRGNLSYVFRNTSTDLLESNVVGDVPTMDQSIVINEKIIDNDSYIGFSFPIDMSLADLGLSGTTEFISSSSRFAASGSQLIVRSADAGFNASAEHRYIYVDNDGWYDTQNLSDGLITGDVIEAGKGYIIRSVGAAEDTTFNHSIDMPYNPTAE